jgi:succinate dehydrogenase / fumarate reductase cytochrome b subunit
MLDARRTILPQPVSDGWRRFAFSSVGAKVVMAVTGLGLWVFIVGHLAGNLAMWAGRDVMNHYSAALKAAPQLVWAVRAALLIGFPIHIVSAIRCARLNRSARPVPYVHRLRTPASLASRTMQLSGGLVLAFFLYHLAHLTLHLTNPSDVTLLADGSVDVYAMVVRGFSVWWISAIYIVGQLLLAQHLSHGISSLFQHLGLWGKAWTPFVHKLGFFVGHGIAIAFSSIPIAVLLGVLRLP